MHPTHRRTAPPRPGRGRLPVHRPFREPVRHQRALSVGRFRRIAALPQESAHSPTAGGRRVSRTRYELIQTFIAEAGANLGRFAELLATYPELELVEDANYELYRLAHTVRGSALSLGLDNTARAARLGEQRLQEYLFEERRIKRAELQALARWRERLGEMIAGYETGDLQEDEAITELERLFADLDDQPGKRDDD
ncbi:MAG: hypothetical protein GF399_07095 [Candidatus Coatesbacteria bacterium]|nr:hypothetical protein [Candidatus Coatesbacteria bacterium]